MNIFVISDNINTNASILDDKRLNKMIIETGQILCSALNIKAKSNVAPYRTTHTNHPCVKWAFDSNNWLWLYQLLIEYGNEYSRRFNKEHKTITTLVSSRSLISTFVRLNLDSISEIDSNNHTPFVNCSFYKEEEVFPAYQKTLVDKWKADKRTPKWTNTTTPSFFEGIN
jgi:hypothetical protein